MIKFCQRQVFVALILFISPLVYAAEIKLESRVSAVCVYPGAAMVTRDAGIKLAPGSYKVIFSDIIPDIDENSLKASGENLDGLKLFGVELKTEFLEEVPSERIKQLKEAIQKLDDEARQIQYLKQLTLDEKNFLDSIRLFSQVQVPKDLATKTPAVGELEGILKFLDAKLRENYLQAMDCEIKLREVANKTDVLRRELAKISGPVQKRKQSIAIDVEADKAVNGTLSVSYLVKGVSWQPIYDARANVTKSECELISYGIVKQTSGEDWLEAELSLSTARPSIGGRMPEVTPWVLRPYQPRRAVMMERKAAQLKEEAYDLAAQMAGAPQAPEVEYASSEEKGIAIVYKLPRRATIKSDGTEHKLPVSSQMLGASFHYSSYPRLSPQAYLGSRVKNSPNLQLLAGEVNIFLEGDYVGKSGLGNIAPGEEFDLYLGADENVKVKRECLEKKVDETLIAGIASPTRRTTFKYRLSVENYKSASANIKLFEAIPVSEDERIKVKTSNISLEPKQKDWENRKGVWLWELSLEPKKKTEIFYTLVIEHPREMQVEGL